MKALCLIFSLYVGLLAMIPCADVFCAGDAQHQSVTSHEDEKADDLCSSFCICSCCGYSAAEFNPVPSRLITSIPAGAQRRPLYKTPNVTVPSLDFWQPPKLG